MSLINRINKLSHQRKIIFAILFLFVLALILNIYSLNDYFLSDDFDFLGYADQVDSWDGFKEFVVEPIGGNIYRPILNLTFLAEYKIWGLNPTPFHVHNVLLHLLNGVLIFFLIKLITKRYWLGFLTAALFLAYPAHHESVTWIGGRTDVLCTTFYLFTIFLFIKFLKDKRYLYYWGSLLALAFALFTKELAISLPAFLLFVAIIYKPTFTWWKKKFWIFIPYFSFLGVYILVRQKIVGNVVGGYESFSKSSIIPNSINDVMNFLWFPKYFIKHAYNIEVVRDIIPIAIEYINLFAVVAFIVLVIIVWKQLRPIKKSLKIFIFSFGFIYLTALPMMNLMTQTRADLQNTRFFYLPSVALCFVIVYFFFNNAKNPKHYNLFRNVVFSLVIIGFSLIHFINYIPWKDASDITLKIAEGSRLEVENSPAESTVYMLNIPERTSGAYVFQNGIDNATKLYNNRQDLVVPELINKPSRSYIKDSCLDPKLVNATIILEWKDGQLRPRRDYLKSWQEDNTDKQPMVWNKSDILKHWIANDLEVLEVSNNVDNSGYKVIGKDPYLISPEIDLDTIEYGMIEIELDISSEDQGREGYGNVYWANAGKSFNESNKVYYIINSSSNKVIIYLCGYPNWKFQENVARLRLDFSDKFESYALKNIKIY